MSMSPKVKKTKQQSFILKVLFYICMQLFRGKSGRYNMNETLFSK